MNPNLERNRTILKAVNQDIYMLEQNILPPGMEAQALSIFRTREKAIEGMLKARRADKVNFEHIIAVYEEMSPL